jgi:hypothetical protein
VLAISTMEGNRIVSHHEHRAYVHTTTSNKALLEGVPANHSYHAQALIELSDRHWLEAIAQVYNVTHQRLAGSNGQPSASQPLTLNSPPCFRLPRRSLT